MSCGDKMAMMWCQDSNGVKTAVVPNDVAVPNEDEDGAKMAMVVKMAAAYISFNLLLLLLLHLDMVEENLHPIFQSNAHVRTRQIGNGNVIVVVHHRTFSIPASTASSASFFHFCNFALPAQGAVARQAVGRLCFVDVALGALFSAVVLVQVENHADDW